MYLLAIGLILLLALGAIGLAQKVGVPALLFFIVLGMALNAVGIPFSDFRFAEQIATLCYLLILFYGGFGTNWKTARAMVKPASVFATLGVVLTSLFIGFLISLFPGISFTQGLLLGAIIGSTDFASVSSVLRSRKLNLKHQTVPLLELESGANDPMAYTLTLMMIAMMLQTPISIPILLLQQIFFGAGIGLGAGWLTRKALRQLEFREDGLVTVFLVAMVLIVFALTSMIGGNGLLSVFLFGLFVGNGSFPGKRDIVFFFDGMSMLMQIGLFFLLGWLASPGMVLVWLPLAFGILLLLTLIVRPVVVFLLALPFRLPWAQQIIVSFTGLRGAAAIVFSMMAVNQKVPGAEILFSLVFGICLLSNLLQGLLLPFVCKKLNMIDPTDTVLKSFNLYQDKGSIGFLSTTIRPGSALDGVAIRDLNLTFDFIVAKIVRDGNVITPRGAQTIIAGDQIVLAGESYFDHTNQELVEFTIHETHRWKGQRLADLPLKESTLILSIRRSSGELITPTGATRFHQGDTIVLLDAENSVAFHSRHN